MYYHDSQIRVTDEAIEVGGRAIPTAELSYVWHQRGRPTARTASRRLARYGLIALLTVPVFVAMVFGAVLVTSQYGPVAQVTVAVLLAGLALVALVVLVPLMEFPLMALERSYDRGTAVREIWVRWRGHDLVLVRTSDAARFGQIYRAIERAVERLEP